MQKNFKSLVRATVLTAAVAAFAAPALAGTDRDAPVTPATTYHGTPGNTPGYGGSSANPAGTGNGVNGGAGIHGIGNTPGQAGLNPNDDDVPGFANQLNTVHGGIGNANKNVGKTLP